MARFERGAEIWDLWRTPGPPDAEWRRGVASQRLGGPVAEDGGAWFSADRTYARLQSERLREGFVRVEDPLRECVLPAEPIHPALEATLREDPGDAHAALVYADWLQQQGHPRGALIAVQHARAAAPDDGELAEREARLFEAHEVELLGAFADRRRSSEREGGVDLVWEHGFLRRVRVDGFMDHGESEDLLWEVLRHPSARMLRELEIGCHHPGDQDNTLMADLLVRSGVRPPLRRLRLGDFDEDDYHGIDISRAPIGDLAGLSTVYPHLEDVMLKGRGDVVLGELALLHARRFAIKTSTLYPETVAAIARAPWPALAELELWFGDGEYGGDCGVADVAPLLERARFPALANLRLMNTMLSDELCPLIVSSTIAAGLVELDFALGTLGDAGAAVLAGHRAAFPALRLLNVFACALSPRGLAQLREAGFPVEERPPSPGRWEGDHAWTRQKAGRYVSDSE